jgi:hypothetical protein
MVAVETVARLVLTTALVTGVASDGLAVLHQTKLIDSTCKVPPGYQFGFQFSRDLSSGTWRVSNNYFRIF